MLHTNASTVRSRLAKARELLRLELSPGKGQEDNSQEGELEGKIRKAW